MKYRYGDATPFPVDENFIETIVAATDACVALFQADTAAESRRRRAMQIQKVADEELKRLAVLAKAVEAALRPMLPDGKPTRTTQATAARIMATARNAVRQGHNGVMKRRDSGIRAVLGEEIGRKVSEALSGFLLHHQLPKTQWEIRWTSGAREGAARAVLHAAMTCNLHAVFDADIPADRPWSGPVRLGSIEPKLVLRLQQRAGLIRRAPHMVAVPLHRYHITGVTLSAERESFVLRKNPRKPSTGYEVVMRAGEDTTPIITRLEPTGTGRGRPLTLSGDGAVALERLWGELGDAMRDLLRYRSDMRAARLGDRPIGQIDEPAEVAEAILGALAPIVREMRLRSRVPGELVLKRDLGDGRREELFVPRKEIERKYSVLPHDQQACFEAVGLGGEATREFVTREFPLAAPREDTSPHTPTLKRAHRLATLPDAA